jgi:hypothetical protein
MLPCPEIILALGEILGQVNEKGTTEKAGTHRTVKFWTVAFLHDR